jgi:cation diffusion facilitator CzcD-associated flavoprotein CzcO
MRVQGARGQTLSAAWQDGPRAYLGITTANMPNFFMLYGPHTNLGHNSITYMIEQQVAYTIKALKGLEAKGYSTMSVKPEAQARFFSSLQEDLAKTVWADPAANSWYKNDKGEITQNWGRNCTAYAQAVDAVQWDDYELA